MPKFNRKPKQVEAIQFTGGKKSADEIILWMIKSKGVGRWFPGRVIDQASMREELHVETPRGVMIATPNHWIVLEEDGNFYPSKPEIFEAKYEKA